MKIFDRPGFPNPARIRIVLAEKGLEPQVEFVSVDLIAAEHKQPAFLEKNPSGELPVPTKCTVSRLATSGARFFSSRSPARKESSTATPA